LRDLNKLIQLGVELDTTSQDRRVKRIYRKAELMNNREIEQELAVDRHY